MNESLYLDNNGILSKFGKKEVYPFGMGKDFDDFMRTFQDALSVKGGFDNFASETMVKGKRVISIKQCVDNEIRGKIVITTRRNRNSIYDQLVGFNLIPGKDFYIWDGSNEFVFDLNTKKIIEWLECRFGANEYDVSKNRVLIPIEDAHDIWVVQYAYISKYLSQKYHAGVDAFIRAGKSYIRPTLKKIYASFGVSSIISPQLTKAQEEKSEILTNEVWNQINDFSSWKEITLFGIRFGTTIVRDYLRRYDACFDPKDDRLKCYLKECIKTIVFWKDWFDTRVYNTVVLFDGAHWEGYIRDIAISKKIPVYSMHYIDSYKLKINDAWKGMQYRYYRRFWDALTLKEQSKGMMWAENRLKETIKKKEEFKCVSIEKFRRSGFVGVVIFPHSLEDDLYMYGPHIFDDNYVSWMKHLGELSEKTPGYNWYIKPHIDWNSERDSKLIKDFLDMFPNIVCLPVDISPSQLKELGIEWALTVQGSIGVELPYIGIQVINAGCNPCQEYEFSFHPKTKQEYDELIFNLVSLEKKNAPDEILQYYSMANLFYDWKKRFIPWNFRDPLLSKDNYAFILEGSDKRVGTWKYGLFLEEYIDAEDDTMDYVDKVFRDMDAWSETEFYKNEIINYD